MGELIARLNLTAVEREQLGGFVGRIKGVREFFGDAIEATKGTGVMEALKAASPWLEAIVDSAGAALPPLKFLLTLAGKLTEIRNPEDLAALACSNAYIAAVQAAMVGESPVRARNLNEYLALAKPSERTVPFTDFQLETAVTHPFVLQSDSFFEAYAIAVGFDAPQVRRLLWNIHNTFVDTLRQIVSDKSAREKFLPFVQMMQLGQTARPTGAILKRHAEHQRHLFRDVPLLKTEPFALSDVYIEPHADVSTWGNIQEALRRRSESGEADPDASPRRTVVALDQVLELLSDSTFREAVVIEGAAGSGKSSFTLHLCDRLLDEGWRPIRVRLHHLGVSNSFREGLAEAIQKSGDPALHELTTGSAIGNVFDVFAETMDVDGTKVCPWVMILDGWDEISISATEGFRQKVEKLLGQVRETLLGREVNPIRVILTGRPSADVRQSNFMRPDTVVLRILPLDPDELRAFAAKISTAQQVRRIQPPATAPQWAMLPLEHFKPAFDDYRRAFEHAREDRSSLDVLGSPLLAHLALRLMSAESEERIQELVTTPTTLLRRLVDLTCSKAGQPASYEMDQENKAHVHGRELRDLLRATAAAITAFGEESIPREILQERLERKGLGNLQDRVRKAIQEHPLSELMISYYFKEGYEELGCEFLHKSFREFLFAEAVVEQLKDYGRALGENTQPPPQKPKNDYWKDFDDQRGLLARELAQLLAQQWITSEVAAHIQVLIRWEIERADRKMADDEGATARLSVRRWKFVREGLADVWDWWGEAVHLRPGDPKPLALELAERKPRPQTFRPPRVTTVDSHLGDGLYRLCALVHFHLAVRDGFLDDVTSPAAMWGEATSAADRRYQTVVLRKRAGQTQEIRLFAPSGEDRRFFENYTFRINAAGWRPQGLFPAGIETPGVDLSDAELAFIRSPDEYPPSPVNWSYSNFARAKMRGAFLVRHNLRSVYAADAACNGATIVLASLRDADLSGADLRGVLFDNVDVEGADITGAHFGTNGVSAQNLIENKAIDRNKHPRDPR